MRLLFALTTSLSFASPVSAQPANVDATLRAVVTRFADARNANDGKAVADTYSEDGEYIGAGDNPRITRGRAALAELWGGLGGQVPRAIKSVETLAPNLAVVHGEADFPTYNVVLLETFVLVKEGGEWKIRVHQAVIKK